MHTHVYTYDTQYVPYMDLGVGPGAGVYENVNMRMPIPTAIPKALDTC